MLHSKLTFSHLREYCHSTSRHKISSRPLWSTWVCDQNRKLPKTNINKFLPPACDVTGWCRGALARWAARIANNFQRLFSRTIKNKRIAHKHKDKQDAAQALSLSLSLSLCCCPNCLGFLTITPKRALCAVRRCEALTGVRFFSARAAHWTKNLRIKAVGLAGCLALVMWLLHFHCVSARGACELKVSPPQHTCMATCVCSKCMCTWTSKFHSLRTAGRGRFI